MSTFLQLCQEVAKDSGTISDLTTPLTTVSQTGRLKRIVEWTRDAYVDLQNDRDDWRWLRTEFSYATIATVQRYAASSLGITSRFGRWTISEAEQIMAMSCWLTARSDETKIKYVPWEDFRNVYLFANAADDTGRPIYVTIDQQDQLVFYPIPDDAYTIRGEYVKSPQIMTADTDVPEVPSAHHLAIKWRALVLLGTFDEATDQLQIWMVNYETHMGELVRKQTPKIRLQGPLA